MTQLVTVLVGPPCCGKSTYLKQLEHDYVISSDNIVESLCEKEGMVYHEFFNLPPHSEIKRQQQHIFKQMIRESHRFDKVVWDLTNMTKQSRQRIIKCYPQAKFNAVVFQFKGKESLLLARNKQRFQAQGKFIAEAVIKQMLKSYQPVSANEGFQEIITLKWEN